MNEERVFIFNSAVSLAKSRSMPIIDAVRQAEEAWEALRVVREAREAATAPEHAQFAAALRAAATAGSTASPAPAPRFSCSHALKAHL